MQLPSKPVWLLIGVHTLCLSVGGWFLYQLISSTTAQQATQDAWEHLANRSVPLAAFAKTAQVTDFRSESTGPSALQTLSIGLGQDPGPARVVIVDRDGRVVISGDRENPLAGSEPLAWQSDESPGPSSNRGWLKTRSGQYAAIRYPMADGMASLVTYDSQGASPAWRTSLMASLPLAAGIAFLWIWVLSSVATYLLSARVSFEESARNARIEHDAVRSAQDLLRTRDAVIFGLAKLAESRDPDTGHHLERISAYSTRLATALRMRPGFERTVTPAFVRLLGISSVLHDIGKVGLQDTVLLKPGRLNDEERKKMQEHTLVASACLKEIEHRLGASNFLQTAREIALHHHERWDGNGYPAGLAGEAIPLAARIVTVADVYDALSSKRVYKDAYPHDECVRLIREGAGTQFDPDLVEVFLIIEADFAAISQRFTAGYAAQAATNAGSATAEVMTPAQESILRDVVSSSNSSCESSQRSSFVA